LTTGRDPDHTSPIDNTTKHRFDQYEGTRRCLITTHKLWIDAAKPLWQLAATQLSDACQVNRNVRSSRATMSINQCPPHKYAV
jgi:hypothetical protein